MAKLHHVLRAYRLRNPAARRARAAAGIKPGMEYWWVKMLRKGSKSGVTRYFRERPKLSQLTLSEYKRDYYTSVEGLEFACTFGPDNMPEMVEYLGVIQRQFERLGERQADKLAAVPESLQNNSPTAELLERRQEQCSDAAEVISDTLRHLREDVYTEDDLLAYLSSFKSAIPSPE